MNGKRTAPEREREATAAHTGLKFRRGALDYKSQCNDVKQPVGKEEENRRNLNNLLKRKKTYREQLLMETAVELKTNTT